MSGITSRATMPAVKSLLKRHERMANSKRKCKFCKVYTTDWVKFPVGTFCSKQHAIDFAFQPKVMEAGRDKRHAHKKKELRESSKSWWVKVTQEDFKIGRAHV